MECYYQLLTFGIPGNTLPIDKNGKFKEKNQKERLERWDIIRLQEQHVPMEDRVLVPGSFDVLLGRGRPLQENPGNIRYRHIIEEHIETYNEASKLTKTFMADDVIKTVQSRRGRFLKLTLNGWTEADDKEARGKVSHSFRSRRTAISKSSKKETSDEGVVKKSSGEQANMPQPPSQDDTLKPSQEQGRLSPAVSMMSLSMPAIDEINGDSHVSSAKRARWLDAAV
jgi:hypothetical protein